MEIEKREIITVITVFVLALLVYIYNATILLTAEWWYILFFSILIAYVLFKKNLITARNAYLILSIFLVFCIAYSFYFTPSYSLAKKQDPVLSDNWFNALTWIEENTAECAVVATYWDPGHFITGIAKRPVVFDGASQNALFIRKTNDTSSEGLVTKQYDNGINRIFMYKDGEVSTARIQDIATTLLTSNETLAVEILKEYMIPGCDEMYYIASRDLISKSQWWTYFSTWGPAKVGSCPTRGNPKGDCYFYNIVYMPQNTGPQLSQNAIIYPYPMSQDQAFLIYETNNTMKPYLQQGGMLLTVEKIFYFTREGSNTMRVYPGSDVKGLIWLSPDRRAIIYIPQQLENAMFTRMYFFNGQDLEKFEFVNSWGGEVKLFKVKLD